ncbi:uracil-DNA glycosylase family protein [Methylococcus geothermalis]|uniref:Uracil-DNA glycosylase n=1 Tax=Methylococcus geothermalis TaxID=2681310 RepID=A0A858QBI8_9GAMM|nr:uracil-DNA glycosylase family protein [Methylococcus geothermalis]QJD31287.1 uracil-DNA glycosylase [Methylococcus geothermalis]
MVPPVVMGEPVASPVYLVGQAPGAKEGVLGKPFAWTAGKTMFRWFAGIGLDEEAFRERVYMAAVCRCFPGKNPKGGDRVPDTDEIEQCSVWLRAEIELLRPGLIIPVGRLAASRFLAFGQLADIVGKQHRSEGLTADLIPLPHPSGASTWHRREPGKTLLEQALALIEKHPAWRSIRDWRAR